MGTHLTISNKNDTVMVFYSSNIFHWMPCLSWQCMRTAEVFWSIKLETWKGRLCSSNTQQRKIFISMHFMIKFFGKRENLGVNDTPVFLLNEYIVELNPANFNILNQILNWISLNWIMFWIEFCPKFSYWIFYWIEFCPKISYWIFYWTESGWKTENQLYFESILWYYTLKYPKNTPKCLIMP